MHIFISLLLTLLTTGSHLPTDQIQVKGRLKTADGRLLQESRLILIYQGSLLLDSAHAKSDGTYFLTFYAGVGTGHPIDFYTMDRTRNTLLLASVAGFEKESEANEGNFFLPRKFATGVRRCPHCHQTDRSYALRYVAIEQKDFALDPAKFYCSRDRRTF